MCLTQNSRHKTTAAHKTIHKTIQGGAQPRKAAPPPGAFWTRAAWTRTALTLALGTWAFWTRAGMPPYTKKNHASSRNVVCPSYLYHTCIVIFTLYPIAASSAFVSKRPGPFTAVEAFGTKLIMMLSKLVFNAFSAAFLSLSFLAFANFFTALFSL